MRLSKAQLRVVEVLQNGGHIWIAAGAPYLVKEVNGKKESSPLNKKTFTHLREHKVIEENLGGNKWTLK